jgi:hypothetical protein
MVTAIYKVAYKLNTQHFEHGIEPLINHLENVMRSINFRSLVVPHHS